MTDELITRMAQVSTIRVSSWNSTSRYKEGKKTISEIGKELKVGAIVEGSVMRSGDRVRITAQLIDVATDRHLWANTYEGDFRDILTLQSEVAHSIAREIRVKLSPEEEERLAKSHPINREAYEAYLKGEMEKAIQLDPNYAPAYAGLAGNLFFEGFWGYKAPNEVFPKMKEAAQKALQLDANLASAHAKMALYRLSYEWNWPEAEKEFRKALELNPSDQDTHHEYAHFLLAMDRPEESVAESQRAVQLNPFDEMLTACLGWHCFYNGQYDQTIQYCLKTFAIEPGSFWGHMNLGWVYEQKSKFPEALAAFTFDFDTTGDTLSDFCGDEQYYKITISSGQTCGIKWTLQSDSNSDYDLYVRWGTGTLSRDSYQYRAIAGKGLKDELSKTGLSSGTYYAMVYKESGTSGSYSITARLLDCEGGEGEEEEEEESPYISSIKVTNNGSDGYIDTGDTIAITFSEEIDPASINDDLEEGDYVTGVSSSEAGGVAVSSAGKVTIKGIATFDMGSVESSENYTVKLALSSSGKVLTITLTSGDDIEITKEDFSSTTQIGGYVEDANENKMASDSDIDDPSGSFGGEEEEEEESPYISSIKVTNNGSDGYIDTGDTIAITFSEEIDPASINDDLEEGDYVTGVSSSEAGGVAVSSAGKVTIKGIATFDMGSVESSENYTVKLALSSSGKVLTITLTSGDDIEITKEDFSSTTQIGGYVEDANENKMASDSDIDDPSGSFGGEEEEEEGGQVSQLQGQINQILDLIAQLREQLAELGGGTSWCYTFRHSLRYKDSGADVTALQTVLQKKGVYAGKIDGYFGTSTLEAVMDFQEKYKTEILTPWRLSRGTGFVGSTTLTKLNQLYGCK